MRVTVATTYQKMVLNLNQKTEDAGRLANMIASGKRISTPQEDPRAWSQAMDLKQGLRELDTFQKNVDFAMSWNETTVNALKTFSDFLDQAIQVGRAAINNLEDRTIQIETLDLISQQALDLANTQYQDLYVFSGSNLSEASFSEDPISGTYTYNGNTDDFEVRVGKNNSQRINLDGEEVFITEDGVNVLDELAALKTALETEPADTEEIQDRITALVSAQEHITAKNTLASLRYSYLDGQKSALSTSKLNNMNQLSAIEDTNTAEAIMQMQQNQTALQAALQVTAMLKDLSLVDFL
jgi:flagellar hook-associated protein 3 FlgL